MLDVLETAGKLLVIAVVAGWATNRLLGVHRRLLATLALGLAGWLVGAALLSPALDGVHLDRTRYLVASGPLAVLVAMLIGVVLLALEPQSRAHVDPDKLGRIGTFPRPVRRTKEKLEPVTRVRQVTRIARSHDLPHLLERWRAGEADEAQLNEAIRATLEESGGMFVKLGQVASTRADLLPAALLEALAELRSDVAPEPAAAIRAVLEEELRAPVETVFADFTWEPLAAASIGQTHRATLRTGERVVVKVQRPGVAELVRRDGAALLSLAGFVDRRTSVGLRLDVTMLAGEFVDGLKAELDFRKEGSNAGLVAEQQRASGIVVPKVFGTFTTARVLVMEEVVGHPVDDAAAIAASGTPQGELAHELLETMLDQMFQRGVFHADPHPGNVFVTDEGKLALIDFGSVGVLTPRLLESLREMAVAAAIGDPTLLRRAVVQIAGAPGDVDLGVLEDQLGLFLSVSLNGASALSADLFGQMLDVMRTNGLTPPPGLTLLTRALVTLEGTLRVIDPDFSLADESEAVAKRWADEAFDGDDWQGLLQDELVKSLPVLRTMPDRVDRLLTLAGSGGLSIRTRVIDNPDDRLFVARWASRMLFAGIGSMGLVASAIMLLAGAGLPASEPLHDGLVAAGVAGCFVSSVLLMRAVAGAFRDSDA